MLLLCWFAILVSVTLHSLQCTIYSEATEEDLFRTKRAIRGTMVNPSLMDELSLEWIEGLLHSSAGFLAGENTPVWIAHRFSSLSHVHYKKLESGVVKRAVDYWKSTEFEGLTIRKPRSINESSIFAKKLGTSVARNISSQTENYNENEHGDRTKRWSSTQPVLYPSVLIMMDYTAPWPQHEADEEKLIYERILYALAFWNAIDLQFRHVQDPKVRFRIAGIIVGRNKEATPYLREHERWLGLKMKEALPSMLTYWHEISTFNENFPKDSFHIIATMTDAELNTGITSDAYAIATPGPPCRLNTNEMGGLILPDDLAFSGIQVAVHEAAHAIGAIRHDGEFDECPMKKGNVLAPNARDIGRTWSECSLRQISRALKSEGSCMEKPREFNPPGKPIEPILPGKLMPASLQCKGRGWNDGHVCWAKITCDRLYCSNNGWYSPCQRAGVPADGTTCGPEKICLDGECISNTRILLATGHS